MTDFFNALFSSDFMPHGMCLLWAPGLLSLHVISDSLIALAYFSIPATLLYFTRKRRDLPYPWVFYLFGAFIVACGTTHIMGIWTLWIPTYWLDGLVKAVTATISVTTAILLVPLVPKALTLRGPRELEEANQGLEQAIRELEQEVLRRRSAEEDLARDIAERKRAEDELKHVATELARSNVELEQFAYIASHDLQEPLRAVAGCVQILRKRYRSHLDASADELIDHSVEGATRMQTLINELLSYSRLTTKGKPFEPTDCSQVLQRTLANLGAAIQERHAVVRSGTLPTVKGDPTQLMQVFQNLIGNAIKFCKDRPPRVDVAAEHTSHGEWLFSVHDNGIGIEPQCFERIFRIFQRLHTRVEYPGTGIGLAICKKIVERHGGRIWVESSPGEGSTFRFTIADGTDGGHAEQRSGSIDGQCQAN